MPDDNEFDFDVFVSFSSQDEAWMRGELLQRIEQAGLTAFAYRRDFNPGVPILNEITRGVTKCRKTLVVLSPDYLQSEWCEIEHLMAAALGPANRDVRLIPLLKPRCEKPLHIRALTHIDFTIGADHDLAWRQLLTALGKAPDLPPPQEPQRDEWFLAHPYPMPPNFTGRVAERTMLNRWLNEDAEHPLLSLRALVGCRDERLDRLQPADAVGIFHAQGIRGTRTEIETACEPYGYHPLSLRLLAGVVMGDFQQPGDISAAKRLDVSGDLVQRQHHVLETAYDSLTPTRRTLLGRIACFRSPVSYEVRQALEATGDGEAAAEPMSDPVGGSAGASPSPHTTSGITQTHLDRDLRDLVGRGLVHHDVKEQRFDLQPIVRGYAYDWLAAPDRAAAHTRLRDYFAAVPEPDNVSRLQDLAPVIELYHHTVRAGQLDEARTLYQDRLDPLYYQLGAYQLIIDLLRPLFPDGEDRAPRLKDESAQAWTLNSLANSYSLSGQPRRAAV